MSDKEQKGTFSTVLLSGLLILQRRKLRRNLIFGFTLLTIFLVFGGSVFLGEKLMERPLAFVVFWLICFVLVGFVLMLAVYDIMAIRRAHRMEMDQLDVDIEVAKFEAEKLLAEERMKAVSQDESSD